MFVSYHISQHQTTHSNNMTSGKKPVVIRTERILKEKVEEYRPSIHDLLIRGFYCFESINNGVGVTDDPESQAQLNSLVDDVLSDGISVIARRADTNQIVGVAINKIQKRGEPGHKSYFETFSSRHITNKAAKLLVDFMIQADASVDLFDELKVDTLVEIMFLCVSPEANGLGAGKALVAASEELAGQLGVGGICALFTGAASQAVGDARGFRVVSVYPHNKVIIDGVPITERLREDQQKSHICGKKLIKD